MKYIDAEKLKAEIERQIKLDTEYGNNVYDVCSELLSFINCLQHEIPDKDTIIRICKLHKVWSIMAPWENIEDFVTTNWNSENIV